MKASIHTRYEDLATACCRALVDTAPTGERQRTVLAALTRHLGARRALLFATSPEGAHESTLTAAWPVDDRPAPGPVPPSPDGLPPCWVDAVDGRAGRFAVHGVGTVVVESDRVPRSDVRLRRAAAIVAECLRGLDRIRPTTLAPAAALTVGPGLRATVAWLDRVAATALPVWLHGESGTGKEGLARRLHARGPDPSGPFVAVNCSSIPEALIEAELFGSTRAAFTGADRDRPGLLAGADGGTLFLDEIADAPPSLQAKLLRAIETGAVRAVGADEERRVRFRLVTASHGDLARRVDEGRFRADLYHRVAVLPVRIPPLRARPGDIPGLVQALAPRIRTATGRPPGRLTSAAHRALAAHPWPGNVRELFSVLCAASLRAGATIGPDDLELASSSPARADDAERRLVVQALADAGGSIARAARDLGWTRQKLYRRLARYSPGRTTESSSSTFQYASSRKLRHSAGQSPIQRARSNG